MHHDLFDVSPPITIDEFHHYLYWHNRGWGNQSQTVEMVVSGVLGWPQESLGDCSRRSFALISVISPWTALS